MSDYLTNIITRSSTVEPAIRPRLVSLFEPASLNPPAFGKEIETHGPAFRQADVGNERAEVSDRALPAPTLRRPTQTRDEQQVETDDSAPKKSAIENAHAEIPATSSRAAPHKQMQISAEPAAPVKLSEPAPLGIELRTKPEAHESIAESLDKNEQSTPVRQTRLVAESVEIVTERRPPATQTRSSLIRPTPLPSERPAVLPQVALNSERLSQLAVERFIQRQQPATPQPNGPVPDSSAPARSVVEVQPITPPPIRQLPAGKTTKEVKPIETRAEREETQAPNRAPISLRNTVQPVSARPAWRANELDREESVSEPTIQVTIGRVEVRGVVEETKKSQPRQSRLMSLDDYLRQRAQGAKQ